MTATSNGQGRVLLIFRFLWVLLLIIPAGSVAAEPEQLDASPALFSVLAAANAAGYDADLESAANSPVRAMVRSAIAARNPSSLRELRAFFAEHKQQDATAELSQYISFALCVGAPPDFKYRYRPLELPRDVASLEGLRPLLAKFYNEAGVEDLWRKAQPAFEAAIARYHQPALDALTQVNAYLRGSTSGPLGTHFQIYVDLLGAPNQIHTRSYKSDYFLVVTPSPEPQAEDVRHAYLHYMLDSLSLRYSQELEKKRGLIDYAQGAPYLEDYLKSDFSLLATECLIKAVESRFAPAARRQELVDQALREGFVMTPALAEVLPAYEKQEQSMRFYYPQLVAAIDLRREERRLDDIQFATERPVRKAKVVVPAERKIELSGAAKTLEDAERLYEARDLEAARGLYSRVLAETAERPPQAKAYYGLARIALRQNDPDSAEKFLSKALESSPEPYVKAWALVYLGRLSDAAGQREQATARYRAALEVPGASETAQQAARKGLEKAFEKQK